MNTSSRFFLSTPTFQKNDLRTHFRLLVAIFAFFPLPAGIFAQGCGVLNNASFESGITGWNIMGGTSYGYNTTLYIADGSASLWIAPRSASKTARVYQDYKAKEAHDYELNFYGGTHDPRYSHKVSMEFYDSSNNLLLRKSVEVDHNVHPSNLLAPYQLTASAPAGTSTLRFIGSANGDYLKIDYVCLTETPAVSFPVEWLEFSVKAIEGDAELTWVTASELNASHFEVERSADRLTYERIGAVAASGNSQSINEYRFTDNQLAAAGMSTAYYRLRQVDFDGSYDWSNTLELSLTPSTSFLLRAYPNPVTDRLVVSLSGEASVKELRILHITGQEIYRVEARAGSGNTSYTIETAHWPAGSYLVLLTSENGTQSQPIIKR
jgi:hypothetical protein